MSSKTPLGRFVWYDLMTTEPEAATAFYTELVGWGTQDFAGTTPYTMWTRGDAPLGGLMPLPDEARRAGAPPHWVGYVSVPDVDQSLSKATELGGKIASPAIDIEEVGRWGVLSDPQGAMLALYTSKQEGAPPPDAPRQVGEFSWHELATTDHQAAFAFYETLFGWHRADAMDLGDGTVYQLFGRGELPVGGMFNKPEQVPGPPFWLYYIRIDDLDAGATRVTQLGGTILNGPMEVPGGDRVAQCLDPQGAAFALHSAAH